MNFSITQNCPLQVLAFQLSLLLSPSPETSSRLHTRNQLSPQLSFSRSKNRRSLSFSRFLQVPLNTVGVTSILGGASDNTGSGIARRLVLKTGLNIILACNIPKNSPMLEADAEKLLVQKLINLGYTRPRPGGLSS